MSAAAPTANFELPTFELSSDWYRRPSVPTAFAISLLLHAAAIVLLPSLRIPPPERPAPLVVELMQAPKAPEPVPEVRAPVEPVKPTPLPEPLRRVQPVEPPPPPVVKPVDPPPVRELVVPQLRPEPPVQKQEQRPLPPEPAPPSEPRIESPPQPAVQPRVETVPERRVEPAAPPARVETPPPPAAVDSGAMKGYANLLSQMIAQKKSYPRLARMRHWEGVTELRLQIGADGKLKELSIIHSSGFSVLDEHALRMVQESQPLPEAPAALRGRDFAINVPVVFRLRDS